jgi:hypothetical protein
MNKQKSPDGGPTPHESAARALGGGTTHARGNAAPRSAVRYSDTSDRPDGLPLPAALAPEPHGGHYFTTEDREKYDALIGYDKGLAPGYDPTLDKTGTGGDERGKYEMRPWTSPRGEQGTCMAKHNFDGSQSIVAIMAVDPAGNVVKLPPDTIAVKKGWKFASTGDISDKQKAGEDASRKEEERRKQHEQQHPGTPLPPPPAPQETPEQKKLREERDPALQAEKHGQSNTLAERMGEVRGARQGGQRGAEQPAPFGGDLSAPAAKDRK